MELSDEALERIAGGVPEPQQRVLIAALPHTGSPIVLRGGVWVDRDLVVPPGSDPSPVNVIGALQTAGFMESKDSKAASYALTDEGRRLARILARRVSDAASAEVDSFGGSGRS